MITTIVSASKEVPRQTYPALFRHVDPDGDTIIVLATKETTGTVVVTSKANEHRLGESSSNWTPFNHRSTWTPFYGEIKIIS